MGMFAASKTIARTIAVGGTTLFLASTSFAQTFAPATPYTRASDSPYFGTSEVGVVYFLEDFEDGLVNTPGLSVNADPNVVVTASGPTTDSVDIDDFLLDGLGTQGRSLANTATGVITLQFDNVALGGWPTRVGLVFTDGIQGGNVTLTVIGSNSSFAFNTYVNIGDGNNNGSTAEDRFLGIELPVGVAQIQIAASGGTVEIDHVQYSAVTAGIPYIKDRFNGDTKSDIALHNPTTNAASIWFMDGLVRIGGGPTSAAPLAGWVNQGTGDFNDDGVADILWRDASNTMRIWLMNGQTVATNSAVIGAGAVAADFTVVGIADINGDDKADILFRNGATENIHAWIMDGVTRTAGGTLGNAAGLLPVGAGDVNGDGKADFIFRNSAGIVSGWLLNGLSIIKQGNLGGVPAIPPTFAIQAIGDLDGDGRADLVWRNLSTGQVNGWLLETLYRKQGGILGTIPLAWTLECTADLNGDSKGDLVWSNSSTGAINGWIMNGLIKVSGGNINTIPTTWQVINR
jgi:hypothetical protein